ncbi:DUF5819 family protein [Streptomyces sulfonofaciens]|uniref:DUF5819 family protein n=1 Tax=Streptomyces sulfonofaciens TaxID=68272 RepID=UPI00167B2F89|nr:DUF5819 family protein [Streptomyces sulfonofaciens]
MQPGITAPGASTARATPSARPLEATRTTRAADQAHGGEGHEVEDPAPPVGRHASPVGHEAPVGHAPPAGPSAPGTGINGLSFRYQVVSAVALAAIGIVVCVHLLLVFLHVAPANTMTKQHGQVVNDWVLPEFEQNWKLFAPNPLQQNIAVEARAQVRTASGDMRTTGWYNFSALDGAAIDGNPLPSHTQQNELRRAWDFFVSSHDNRNRPIGTRGKLSEGYLRRIMALRLSRVGVGGKGAKDTVVSVQVRSMTTNVQPPVWSGEGRTSTKPFYRTLSWWPVSAGDLPSDAAAAAGPQDAETEANPR